VIWALSFLTMFFFSKPGGAPVAFGRPFLIPFPFKRFHFFFGPSLSLPLSSKFRAFLNSPSSVTPFSISVMAEELIYSCFRPSYFSTAANTTPQRFYPPFNFQVQPLFSPPYFFLVLTGGPLSPFLTPKTFSRYVCTTHQRLSISLCIHLHPLMIRWCFQR